MTKRICGVTLGLWMLAVSASAQAQPTVGTLCQSTPGVWTPCEPGGGGSFNGLLLDAASGDPVTDTVNDALRVNVVAGAGSGGTAMTDDAAFTAATTNVTPAGAVFDDTAPDSVNEGDGGAVRMSGNRNLYSTIRDAAGNERGVNVTAGNALTVDGSASTQPVVGTLANDGAAAATNRVGTLPAVVQNAAPTLTDGRNAALSLTTGGAARVIVTNAAGAASTLATDVTEDAAETAGGTGPSVMSVRRDTPASSAGTSGDNATFNTNATGALYIQDTAGTAGGADAFSHLSAGATEDEHAVKATAGTLYSITATNTNAAVRYLKCENDTAANTAPGTDTPELRIAIPGATTGAGFSTTFPVGYSFSTALTCWLVTGAADSDVAEVAANELMVFYTFK